MLNLSLAKWAGWPLAALCFWLWLGARDDLATEREACNTRTAQSAAQAQKAAREAAERAFQARLAKEREMHGRTLKALKTAEATAQAALSRPPEVKEVIRREIDADACLRAPLPDAVARSLRGD